MLQESGYCSFLMLKNFMSSLATLNGSTMVEPENITSLCRYFKIEVSNLVYLDNFLCIIFF